MSPFHLETPKSGRSSAQVLPGVVVVFNLLILAFAGWFLSLSRSQYIGRAEMVTHNLAQVLEQNLLATVNQIDLVLLTIKDEVERRNLLDRENRIRSSIQNQSLRVGLLDGLRTADAQGRIDRGTGVEPREQVSLADRDYFHYLKEHPAAGLVITEPLLGRISGKWVLVFARRLNQPEGGFAGVVFGTVALDTLSKSLSEVDVGRKGSISLRGANGELLARFPKLAGQDQLIGDRRIQGEYLEAVQSGRIVSRFTTHSRMDGQTRTYTFRRIPNPTFFILVGLSQEEYLHAWRQEALLAALSVAGLIALSLGLTWMARTAWRRQARVRAYIEAQEAKFRLLAENAEDVIWTANLKGRITYISPVVTTQRGYDPDELLGVSFLDRQAAGQGTDPLRPVLDRIEGLPPGSQPFEGEWLEAELSRKGGGRFQAEIRLRLIWNEAGELLGFQGVTRDITERARLEAERENLIRDLQKALAEVKNLEGMLPICGHCKKIRDDQGYWNHLESYISAHSEATFTHGVCPDCAEALRQEMRQLKDSRDTE